MNTTKLNEKAWDNEVDKLNTWTEIISEDEINRAKNGDLRLWVTPEKYVPLSWIEKYRYKELLLLASSGGQQTPLCSSYGFKTTSVDISEKQLNQDRIALKKYNLDATLIKGDISSLSFKNNNFDLVISSNAFNFIKDLRPIFNSVWKALKDDGAFIFGITNPIIYTLDEKTYNKRPKVKYTLPFSTEKSKSKKEINRLIKKSSTFEFSHTLEEIIGGILDSGFIITGFYSSGSLNNNIDSYFYDSNLAFNCVKSRTS